MISDRNGFSFEPEQQKIVPSTMHWNRLESEYGTQREFIIEGVLRQREIMGLVAATKAGKSFLALDMAMSLATGRGWLKTFAVPKPQKVLFIDGEMRPDTMFDRLRCIQYHRRYDTEILSNNLEIEMFRRRGECFDIRRMKIDYFPQFKGNDVGFVILDCLYKFLPAGWSESDHSHMAQFVEICDQIANMLNCGVCVIHHSTKGAQGAKNQTDIGSGAGTFQRAVDTLLTIRPHEKEDYSVMETSARSMRAIDPVSMFYTHPIWNVDQLETAVVASPETASAKAKKAEDSLLLETIYKLGEFSVKDIRNALGCGIDKANRLRLIGMNLGRIEELGMQKRKHSKQETMIYTAVNQTGTRTGMETGTA